MNKNHFGLSENSSSAFDIEFDSCNYSKFKSKFNDSIHCGYYKKINIKSDGVFNNFGDDYSQLYFIQHIDFDYKQINKVIYAIYEAESLQNGRMANLFIVFFLGFLIQTDRKNIVNYFLCNLDFNLLSEWSYVAILRTSYKYRFEIYNWDNYILSIKCILDDKGKNSSKILRGFIAK